MNHVRLPNVAWVNMRQAAALANIVTPFDTAAHTAEVRRIARRRGRFNIPNIGIHLWRIRDFPVTDAPAVKLVPANAADRRYLFGATGSNTRLYNHAVAEDAITHIAERENVPMPITRRELWDDVERFYPASIAVKFGSTTLPPSAVAACDLSDFGADWAYAAADTVLIDPVLGRLSLPPTLTVDGRPVAMTDPIVSYHYGFSAEIGGGPYGRLATLGTGLGLVVPVTAPASIGTALGGLAGSGVVEVRGNGRFAETLGVTAAAGVQRELRAADGVRPTIVLGGDLVITVADDADVTLNGLLITGGALRVAAASGRGHVRIRHCTLVPGIALDVDGMPIQPAAPSLIIESDSVTVEIEQSIIGAVRAHEDATVRITDSIVDATTPTGVAYAALDANSAGGVIEIVASTVIGKVHARILELVSNSIIAARLATGDTWTYPLWADRRQEGCVRFSYVPPGSRTPRRHQCQPSNAADALRVQPQFTADRYGEPAYCQLSGRTPSEIRTGADDESEMGAFHHLYAPQRETNIGVRLEEYLRFGLEAGIFYAS